MRRLVLATAAAAGLLGAVGPAVAEPPVDVVVDLDNSDGRIGVYTQIGDGAGPRVFITEDRICVGYSFAPPICAAR